MGQVVLPPDVELQDEKAEIPTPSDTIAQEQIIEHSFSRFVFGTKTPIRVAVPGGAHIYENRASNITQLDRQGKAHRQVSQQRETKLDIGESDAPSDLRIEIRPSKGGSEGRKIQIVEVLDSKIVAKISVEPVLHSPEKKLLGVVANRGPSEEAKSKRVLFSNQKIATYIGVESGETELIIAQCRTYGHAET